MNELVPVPVSLPPELEGWIVVRATPEAEGVGRHDRGYVIWLERVMPDGTTLRFEALIHDYVREIPMLVPVIQAVTAMSAPDVRLSVTRSKTTRFELRRGEKRRKLVAGRM